MRRYLILLLLIPIAAYATVSASASASHTEPAVPVIFVVTLLFFFGLVGSYIAKRFHQPGVLGELLIGVLVGNFCYFMGVELAVVLREGPLILTIMHDMLSDVSTVDAVNAAIKDPQTAAQVTHALREPRGTDLLKVAYVLDIFSRYGVIFLLFTVGLETSLTELKNTGGASLKVALIGIIAPISLALLATAVLLPESSFQTDLFVAATLAATSIGITARVLKDLNKLRTREAKTILGAAMLDDILGLVLLAFVSGLVIEGTVSTALIIRTLTMVALFFITALTIGPYILKLATKRLDFLSLWEAKLFTAFLFLMGLAWLASIVNLAPIIGAFVAGVIMHDGFFIQHKENRNVGQEAIKILDLIAPLESILAPLFFILIGIQVKLETFLDWHVIGIAAGLLVAAIIGKVVSGFGASKKSDKLLIGIGMLPRGEVGLVFASVGKTMGVMSDQLFSAIVLMVLVTTLIAPPLLKYRFKKPGNE